MNKQSLISIVVPIYNEAEIISSFVKEVEDVLVEEKYEIIFVCDPSTDGSEKILEDLSNNHPKKFKTLLMSRRFGQHKCIIAGLRHTEGSAVVVMDVDGQDPITVIPKMLEKLRSGFDVVYGKRLKREKITLINKLTSKVGLFFVSKLSYLDIPTNVGEFRIMSKKVVNELNNLSDFNPFLRGMVSYVGFKQTSVSFVRPQRISGETKYSKFFGSISFGVNALTSFSNKLLNFSILMGLIISFISMVLGFIYLYFKITGRIDFPIGNPTIVILLLFLGGIQLFSIGILGIYIGQISDQVKNRPMYIVETYYGDINKN